MIRRRVVHLGFAALAGVIIAGGCAGEPPFEVRSAGEKLEEAQGGFGTSVLDGPEGDDVLVHRTTCLTAGGEEIPVDVYYPPRFGFRRPASTVFVSVGNPEWSYSVSLGRVLAAAGLVAAVPDTRNYPFEFSAVIEDLRGRSTELFIDPGHIGLWGEGHVSAPVLEAAMNPAHPYHDAIVGAAFLSPVLFFGEQKQFTHDADALSEDVPVFIATAVDDEFYEVGATIDSFRDAADIAGVPVEYVEVSAGGHNWMSDRDAEETRAVIEEAIDFVESGM